MTTHLNNTVTLPSGARVLAARSDYEFRTIVRRDGSLAYELVDKLANQVKARSRNFSKVYNHLKARLRGTRGG